MTSLTENRPVAGNNNVAEATPVVALKRRTIDSILIGVGAVLTVALVVAGALLSWGASFSADYVGDELSSQNITFAPAEALEAEGRADLVNYGGEYVHTGPQAAAYASNIDGHPRGPPPGPPT